MLPTCSQEAALLNKTPSLARIKGMKHILSKAVISVCTALTIGLFFACKTTTPSPKKPSTPPAKEKETRLDLWQHRAELRNYIKNEEGKTYTYRDGNVENITLGEWNSGYCFHSLKIGDDYSVIEKKLKPDFELAYKLQSFTKGFIYMEKSRKKHYLEISLDEKNRVYLINYQYDHVYSLD